MTCRSVLLSAGLLAMTSACSGASSSPPGDFEGLDAQAEAEGAVVSDDADSREPLIDASTSRPDSGSPPVAHDAGTVTGRDAGGARVACNQPALGVCQSATVSAAAEASYRMQCTRQGGTAEACPTSGLVGCCVGDTSHYCYYSTDYTPATAQQDCSIQNGTWSTSM
jgi:hypothetical protein